MSTSGWWSCSSATSATRCTSRMPSRNVGACTSRLIASPSRLQADRSPASAWSTSSFGSSAIAVSSDLVSAGAVLRAQADLGAQPDDRVELPVDDALLHRDDRVVGDVDAFGADLGAALGDVAQADAGGLLRQGPAVVDVERVHV